MTAGRVRAQVLLRTASLPLACWVVYAPLALSGLWVLLGVARLAPPGPGRIVGIGILGAAAIGSAWLALRAVGRETVVFALGGQLHFRRGWRAWSLPLRHVTQVRVAHHPERNGLLSTPFDVWIDRRLGRPVRVCSFQDERSAVALQRRIACCRERLPAEPWSQPARGTEPVELPDPRSTRRRWLGVVVVPAAVIGLALAPRPTLFLALLATAVILLAAAIAAAIAGRASARAPCRISGRRAARSGR